MNKKSILAEIERLVGKNDALYSEKNELNKRNDELKKALEASEKRINELQAELIEKDALISELRASLSDEIENKIVAEATDNEVHEIEEKADYIETSKPNLSDMYASRSKHEADKECPVDYGDGVRLASKIIGEAVKKCTELCAEFAENGGSNAKDLINLALGRTEVLKSEALSVIEEAEDISSLGAQLKARLKSTLDYFELLKRQI